VIKEKLLSGEFQALAIYNSDRLFRSPRHFFDYLEEALLPSRCAFISATEDIDISTEQGRTLLGIIAVFNGFYRDRCSQNARRNAAARVAAGRPLGHPAYGWESASADSFEEISNEPDEKPRRGIQRVPAEGEHLLWMKDRVLDGWGTVRIARELNEKKRVRTRSGKQWTSATIRRVLLNPVQAGQVHHEPGGVCQPGKHFDQRYWDMEDLQEMKRVLQHRKNHKTRT
jgi:DNA invertase Pin-like site-specific DNA recombinase